MSTRGASGPHKRLVSVYAWGPMGLVVRRGVSVRDGTWDPNGGDTCDPGPETAGAFVDVEPDKLCDYTYMTDAMGNVVGLVDASQGVARRQVFDAFGNNIGGYLTFQCSSDQDYSDDPWHLYIWGCDILGEPTPGYAFSDVGNLCMARTLSCRFGREKREPVARGERENSGSETPFVTVRTTGETPVPQFCHRLLRGMI